MSSKGSILWASSQYHTQDAEEVDYGDLGAAIRQDIRIGISPSRYDSITLILYPCRIKSKDIVHLPLALLLSMYSTIVRSFVL